MLHGPVRAVQQAKCLQTTQEGGKASAERGRLLRRLEVRESHPGARAVLEVAHTTDVSASSEARFADVV